MYTVSCPYCADHVVCSEYWDVIEEAIDKCYQEASPEDIGRVGYVFVMEGFSLIIPPA